MSDYAQISLYLFDLSERNTEKVDLSERNTEKITLAVVKELQQSGVWVKSSNYDSSGHGCLEISNWQQSHALRRLEEYFGKTAKIEVLDRHTLITVYLKEIDTEIELPISLPPLSQALVPSRTSVSVKRSYFI